MQDDKAQAALATRLLESLTAERAGFVPLVVIVELAWVLSSVYDLNRSHLVDVFEALLRTRELVVECAETAWKALRLFGTSNADFADCLIERAAAVAGCERTLTFDRKAATGCGMELVT
jgi:predicted nucleic-acid-binding protein